MEGAVDVDQYRPNEGNGRASHDDNALGTMAWAGPRMMLVGSGIFGWGSSSTFLSSL